MIEKIYLVYFKGTVILAMFVRGSLQVEVNLSIAGWSHVQPVLNQFSWAKFFIVILVKLVLTRYIVGNKLIRKITF